MQRWAAVFALLFFVPSANANPGLAVEQCSRDCLPQDVNDGVRVGDEPVNVILYGHFQSLLGSAPLNTQLPSPEHEPDVASRSLMPSLVTRSGGCIGDVCGDFEFQNNVYIMSTVADRVTYLEDGAWRTHNFPGFGRDVHLVGPEAVLYWYMSADAKPTQDRTPSTLGAAPQMAVHARLTPARSDPLTGPAYAESAPLVETPRTNLVSLPGQDSVFEFRVPMTIIKNVVPGGNESTGIQVVVHAYQVAADGVPAEAAQAELTVHTGARFLPRVILPTVRPLQTESSSVNLFQGDVFLRWSVSAAFASYDVNGSSVRIRQTAGPELPAAALDFLILKRSVDHDGMYKPVNTTWKINTTAFPLKDGSYEFEASIRNLQNTYELREKIAFDIRAGKAEVDGKPLVDLQGEFPGKSVIPMPPLGWLISAALALVFLRRRNEHQTTP